MVGACVDRWRVWFLEGGRVLPMDGVWTPMHLEHGVLSRQRRRPVFQEFESASLQRLAVQMQ